MKICISIMAASLLAVPAAAIKPGMWQTNSKTVDMDMALPPSVPANMRDMIKSQMAGRSYSQKQCITQADIDQAPEKMFKQSEGKCEYQKFDMSGGKLDAVATCKMQGTNMRMVMTGTHSDTTYKTRMVMSGMTEMGKMNMTVEGTGKRVGNC